MLRIVVFTLLLTNIHAIGTSTVHREMEIALDPEVDPNVQEILLKDVFQTLDADQDGVLSKDEARPMTSDLYTMLATLFKNGDGVVTKESFVEHAVGVGLEDFGNDITDEQCNEEDALVSATTDDLWFSIAGQEEELSAQEFAERMWDTTEDDESIMTFDDFLDRSKSLRQKFSSANEATDTKQFELPTHFIRLDDYTESRNEKCVATKGDRRRLCPQCVLALIPVVATWVAGSVIMGGISCAIQELAWKAHKEKKWEPKEVGEFPAWALNGMFNGGCHTWTTLFHDFVFSMFSLALGGAWKVIADKIVTIGLAAGAAAPAAAAPYLPAPIGAPVGTRRLLQAAPGAHGWPMHSVNGGIVNPTWDVSPLGTDLAWGEWDGFSSTSLATCASKAAQRGVRFFAWSGQVYGGYCKVLKSGIPRPNLDTHQGYGYKLYEPHYGTVNCRLTIDNYLISVKYDGKEVPVSGNKNSWYQVKSFSFTRKAGAILEIVGKEHDNVHGQGCARSGMLLECDSGLTSNTHDWYTHGSADGVNWQPSRRACQSSSGFHTNGATPNAQKIWSGNGERFAKFMTIPVYFNEINFEGATGPVAILLLSEYVSNVVHQMVLFYESAMRFLSIGSLLPGILPPGIGGVIGEIGGGIGGIILPPGIGGIGGIIGGIGGGIGGVIGGIGGIFG